jgi:hypothetical protein
MHVHARGTVYFLPPQEVRVQQSPAPPPHPPIAPSLALGRRDMDDLKQAAGCGPARVSVCSGGQQHHGLSRGN